MFVYTGPLYSNEEIKIVGNKTVPTHFFKVIILEENEGTLDVKCYTVENNNNPDTLEIIQLDEIEKRSGLVFSIRQRRNNLRE